MYMILILCSSILFYIKLITFTLCSHYINLLYLCLYYYLYLLCLYYLDYMNVLCLCF